MRYILPFCLLATLVLATTCQAQIPAHLGEVNIALRSVLVTDAEGNVTRETTIVAVGAIVDDDGRPTGQVIRVEDDVLRSLIPAAFIDEFRQQIADAIAKVEKQMVEPRRQSILDKAKELLGNTTRPTRP